MPANRGNIVVTVLLIVVTLIGVAVAVYLVQQRQSLQSEAAVPDGQATVSLTPSTGSFNVGDPIQMSVFFNTADIPISGVAIRLRYPFAAATPEISVASIDINSAFLNSPDWTCPVVSSFEEGSEVIIDIACANGSALGFATNTDTLLAQVTLNVNEVPGTNPLSIQFDPTLSVITQKSTGQDILAIPDNQGTYTVTSANQTATVSPTGSVSATATVSPTTTATPTGTATATPTGTRTITPTTTTTATPTPDTLPDAGVSTPTLIGFGAGLITLLFAAGLFAL